MEDSGLCDGIVYKMSSDLDRLTHHKGELAMLLLKMAPVPILVLVMCHGGKAPSEEEVSTALGLTNYSVRT